MHKVISRLREAAQPNRVFDGGLPREAARPFSRLPDPRDTDIARVIENAEGKQQPHDDANYHDDVENSFDLPVHRDVGINQPEQHANNDQSDDERYQ
jgi:hypothetical protein